MYTFLKLNSGSTVEWLTLTLAAVLVGCGTTKPDDDAASGLILATDPRFATFELPSDRTVGTVMQSFKASDSRYCRAARFMSDNEIVLACRIDRGWQIQAISDLGAEGAKPVMSFGGATQAAMKELYDTISILNPGGELLDERELLLAASNGWQ